MASPRSSLLPPFLIASIVVIIVVWFATLVFATPPPLDSALLDRISAEAVGNVSVSQSLSPRVEVDGSPGTFMVGRGSVRAGFADARALAFDDLGGTFSFKAPSARLIDVSSEVLYLESADGERLSMPADVTELQRQLEVSLKHEAVVGGVISQADEALLRHLSSRLNPLGYAVEVRVTPTAP